jgi:hypothetical protein
VGRGVWRWLDRHPCVRLGLCRAPCDGGVRRLLKESTKEGKARVKAELDKKVLIDQIRALKKHNAQLALRSKEEVKAKLKEHEERKAAQEKVRTLSGRLTFLLNKLQADEEAKVIQREEIKKLEAQLRTLQDKNECVAGLP